jgi:hypothetical protein
MNRFLTAFEFLLIAGALTAQTNLGVIKVRTVTIDAPNSTNGTVCNGLAKIDQTAGSGTSGKVTATTGGEQLAVGVVIGGCGTTGTATLAITGYVQIVFDTSSVSVGDAVGISSSVNGGATDLGSNAPSGGTVVIGQISLGPPPSNISPSGCTVSPGCWLLLKPVGSPGGGGSANAVVTNPATTLANTIQSTTPAATSLTSKCPSGASGTATCLQVNNNSNAQVLGVLENGQVQLGSSALAPNMGSGTTSATDWGGLLAASGTTVTYTFTGSYTVHPLCFAIDLTSGTYLAPTYTGATSVSFGTTANGHTVQFHCPFTK